jgi:hypothetical protein
MFRFLSMLFLAVFLVDSAVSALETRRVWVMGSIVLKRKTSPIGYWAMTAVWLLIALGSLIGVPFLSYQALVGAGPFKEHTFFSLHQAWPYAATAILFGWLAIRIGKHRLFQLRRQSRTG